MTQLDPQSELAKHTARLKPRIQNLIKFMDQLAAIGEQNNSFGLAKSIREKMALLDSLEEYMGVVSQVVGQLEGIISAQQRQIGALNQEQANALDASDQQAITDAQALIAQYNSGTTPPSGSSSDSGSGTGTVPPTPAPAQPAAPAAQSAMHARPMVGRPPGAR